MSFRGKHVFYLIVALFFVLLSFFVYHWYSTFGPRQFHYHMVSSVSLEGEGLGNYTLSQNIKSVFPKPIMEFSTDQYDYYKCDNGVEIATKRGDDKIIRISTDRLESNLETSKGIKIGGYKNDVISSYGTSYYTREELGLPIMGYIDKIKHQTIEFSFSNDQIAMIRYDKDYMD